MTSSLEVVDPQEDHQNFVKHSHSWVVTGGGPLSDVYLVLKYQECALVVGSFMDNLHVTSTVVQGVLRGFDPNLVMLNRVVHYLCRVRLITLDWTL